MHFECSVCNSPVEEKDRDNVASLVKCGHICHFTCLEAYLGLIKECPQCDSKVTKGSMIRIYPRPGEGDHSLSQEDSRVNGENESRENMSELAEENYKLKEKIKDLNNQSQENIKGECNTLNQQIEDLNKNLSDAKKELQIWEILFEHLSNLNASKALDDAKQIEILNKTKSDLERDLSTNKKDKLLWEILFEHLQGMTKESNLMMPNDDAMKLINKLMIEYHYNIDRELSSTKAELDSTRISLNSIKTERDSPKKGIKREETLEECVESLQLTIENSNLRSQLENVKKQLEKYDKSVTDLVVQYSKEVNSSTENKTKLNAMNEMLTEINASLERENKTLAKEKVTLLEEMNIITAERISVHDQNNALKEEYEALKKEYRSVLGKCTLLQKENDALKQDIDSLHNLNKQLEEKLNAYERNNSALQTQIEEVIQDNVALTKGNKTLIGISTILQQENDSLKRDHDVNLNEVSEDNNLNKHKINNSALPKEEIKLDKEDLTKESLDRTTTISQQENDSLKRDHDGNLNEESDNSALQKEVEEIKLDEEDLTKDSLDRTTTILQKENECLKRDHDVNLNKENEDNDKEVEEIKLDKEDLTKESLDRTTTILQQENVSLKRDNSVNFNKEEQKATSLQNESENLQQNKSLENITRKEDNKEHKDVLLNTIKELELKKLAFERCFRPDKRKILDTSMTPITPEKRSRKSDERISEPCSTTPSKSNLFDLKQEASTSRSEIEQASTSLDESKSQEPVIVVEDSQ